MAMKTYGKIDVAHLRRHPDIRWVDLKQKCNDMVRPVQVLPVVVAKTGQGYTVLDGLGRVKAVAAAGVLQIDAVVVDLGDDALQCYVHAVDYNAHHLTDADRLHIVSVLRDDFKMTDAQRAQLYARWQIGDECAILWQQAERLSRCSFEVREAMATQKIKRQQVVALLDLKDQSAFAELVQWVVATQMNTNEQKVMVQHLADIARRSGVPLKKIYDELHVADICSADIAARVKYKKCAELVRRSRYPVRSEIEDKIAMSHKQLECPLGVAVELPVDLEGDVLMVRMAVRQERDVDTYRTWLVNKVEQLKALTKWL